MSEQGYVVLKNLEVSDWECHIAGVVYRPQKGKEPNAFWRWTQYLVFGIKWKKAGH